jgi:hypothetical protein
MCLQTKPGDASGVRSTRCDEIAPSHIETCLQGDSSAGASRSSGAQPGGSAAGGGPVTPGAGPAAPAPSSGAPASGYSR